MAAVAYSWRKFYKVHPSAERFDLLSQDELKALAKDIEKNGLKISIQTRRVGSHLKRVGWSEVFVIDGRNRLDAMESLGWHVVNAKGEWAKWSQSGSASGGRVRLVEHKDVATHKEIALEIIGFNVRRRHLTKQQQVDLIDEALKAARKPGKNDRANIARSFSPTAGKRGGSTKDPHKEAVMEQASKEGISKRTVELVLDRKKEEKGDGAKPKPKRRKPQPEVPDDPTSRSYVKGQLDKFFKHWPQGQELLVKARIAQDLLSRSIAKSDASGRRVYATGETLPVSITYATPVVIETDPKTDKITSGATVKMAEMFEEWQRVLDKP